MISCREIRNRLSPYIDGRLQEEDRRLVQGHLESCDACRDEMEALIALDQDLREAHASGEPGAGHLESLADGFPHRFDLAAARTRWERPGATRRVTFLPPIPSRWIPALRLALTTAVLAGVVLAVREAGRLTTVPTEADEQAMTSLAMPDADPPDESPPIDAIAAFFAAVLDVADTPAQETGTVRMRSAPEPPAVAESPGDDDEAVRFSILEGREADPSLPDTLWTRIWRAAARSLADQAMDTSLPEDCIRALRAYWMMSHRAGRSLQSSIEDQNDLYEPERPRLEYLMECAPQNAGPAG